ncbi:uncharacterized protein LOC122922696 [Bufo gargarizans]|uniref:uncharacterized protein LOC122922687 n=1 Tax=Bufo gargarizans TaxID=30331 RepID=UPI001CF3917A|nr:uncharacterized protein LOC122922687 [Bufo gargarizans]XP_044129323.1 uncharacterized protein LOC122922696 [Bufo gargarizans]
MTVAEDIQKRLSKVISKEVVRKRYLTLKNNMKTPTECRKLLDVAKPCFLNAIKAAQERFIKTPSKLEIIYYLEALLVLKHLQRPGVVANMSVSKWKDRVHHTYKGTARSIIGVRNHKTATQQVASFVLTGEKEMWFKVYFAKVRPTLINRETPRDIFFLSTQGRKIHNVSNDINRYHRKYLVPEISSQVVRRVCESWTTKYLSLSNITAERSFREKTLTDLCHACELVTQAELGKHCHK